ncbi:MAG: MarR family transcriptional regulator [Candidatus Pacearchaeota archaeon]|jgi:predicted transcriptional regulator|nr:MarR family transcriptional regulator [Candidatus Pacearchaeota archaeon]
MIDFACKKFDLEEVIKCSLGLSKAEFRLLKFLVEHEGKFTTEDLSKKLKLDKSTIQRSVKKLHEKNLVSRSQVNQSVGGYIFLYSLKDKGNIRKIVTDTIDNWVNVFKSKISAW